MVVINQQLIGDEFIIGTKRPYTIHGSENIKQQMKQFNESWLNDAEFKSQFELGPNIGSFCKICKKQLESKNHVKEPQMTEEAFQRQQADLRKYLTNFIIHERAKEAEESMKIDEILRTVNLNDDQMKLASEQQVKIIYYAAKYAIANYNIESLQYMIISLGCHKLLQYFHHTSSTSTAEFLEIISDYLTSQIVQQVHKAGLCAACCDESTDISTFNQFITFVIYVDSNGVIQNKFMDIRSLGEKRRKALNLLDKFKSVAKEKELDLLKLCCFSCDGAAAMIGVKHEMTTPFKQELITLITTYRHAHRLAFSTQDATKLAQFFIFRKSEGQLLQLHHYFAKSPLHAAQLASIHTKDMTEQKKLVASFKVRWLSCSQSVDASIIELPSILKCLKIISEENFEVMAEGLLNVTTKFSFLSSLFILKPVLFQLKILSETFQEGNLCDDQIKPSFSKFRKKMEKINEEKISSQILRENQARHKTFLEEYSEGLGELDEKKMSEMEELSCKYVDATLKIVKKKFQVNDIMSSFKIFCNTADPEKIDDNSVYGNFDLKILNNRFWKLRGKKSCEEADVEILKEWKDFRQQLNDNFIGCTTRDVQRRLIRSQSFLQYSMLRMLAQVALAVSMSSALAE
ncbi:MAG: putative Zinc finger protein 862 [Streblomastix strix]|uniref:Putative Zinc finger protein 862 n=1 Tax=Streblomastix strix TaxID=222440 RepID=A0A5J4VD23_9EUKA|nr:MAG: putative Zinc finger protein 862 [Streblomastix strix]